MPKIIIDFDDDKMDLSIEGEKDGMVVLDVLTSVSKRIITALMEKPEATIDQG